MTKNYIYLLVLVMTSALTNARAQDLNFAEARDMTKWYNPSIQQDQNLSLSLNYRDVRYESAVAYRTTAGMFNLPFKSKDANSGFWSFNLGFALDQADQGILGTTQAQMGFSYALPLSAQQTFMSVSVQGAYVNSRLDLGGITLPDQFDQNGPIANAVTQDPLGGGDTRNWFSSHLGVSLFKRADDLSWNLGVSLRDVTSPEINRPNSTSFQVKPTLGLQAGCAFGEGQLKYTFNGLANWKAQAFEALLAAGVKHGLESKSLNNIGFGMAYRLRDALIPSISIGLPQSQLNLFYDINISGVNAAGYKRNAFEISLKHTFTKSKN